MSNFFCVSSIEFDCRNQSNSIHRLSSIEKQFDWVRLTMPGVLRHLLTVFSKQELTKRDKVWGLIMKGCGLFRITIASSIVDKISGAVCIHFRRVFLLLPLSPCFCVRFGLLLSCDWLEARDCNFIIREGYTIEKLQTADTPDDPFQQNQV